MQETVCRTRLLMQEEKGEEIKNIVEKWLIRVDKKIEEAVKLIEYEEKAKRSCCEGLSPNLKNRYQLGKKATFTEKALIGSKEEAEKFNQISHCTVPKETWTKSTSKIMSRLVSLLDIQTLNFEF